MKKLILFIGAGLFLGLAVGSFVRGAKERDVILERLAAEKAAAEAQEESSPAHHDASVEGEAVLPDSTVDPDASEAGEEIDGEVDPQAELASGEDAAPEGHGEGGEESAQGDGADHGSAPTGLLPAGAPSEAGSQGRVMGASTTESLPPEGPARLAKIFGAMEPKDAAAVLQALTDGEAQVILMNMSDRKVAEILGEFEPERAATLSRIVLEARAGKARSR